MNKLNNRSSFAAMTYDAKRLLSLFSNTKVLINISRTPFDKDFNLKTTYLPVVTKLHQRFLSNGGLL
ncbi:hypothetical protein A6J40_12005 [Legionella longbeachae]|nr:hypothetical protein A6J40_12005 [Legionella longbeachae]VEE04322.1 Uncharacterised protein [Legionella oakridgensis]